MANKDVWWPGVSDLLGAEKAIKFGFGAAACVVTVTAIIALLALYLHKPILGIDGAGLGDAVIFAAIAFGINRKSRAAAVCGLVLYLGERAYMLANGPATSTGGALTVIFTLYFVHGVRGTFAYRKLSSQAAGVHVTTGA